ncbi:RsmE family RNA methyltransferase [Mesoplasma corruscae]|uniref:Ribosomal RNA small subunit methyltransferase E n=1 Tax=Mesoplasma corruscae TaxID=216874 RepID=A0A2S5REN4_9MOLU|nr:16S rRNA (uracil(1498)-N(3))-methyltransferase [Mesoplasma corruscae]PPE05672.1 16S ribosomal RNA methyltransferase RsmE [Mesoplasma corruscae]
MFRFFVNKKIKDNFLIERKDTHHIKNVIKLQVGEKIECVFENNVYLSEISDLSQRDIVLAKELQLIKTNSVKVQKTLIAGVLREQKWDWLLQKATELGVDQIVPVVFSRNVVKIDINKKANKVKRWQTICDTAAKQSKRNKIPLVCDIVEDLYELKQYLNDINLVAWEEELDIPLNNYLEKDFNSISFIIGCEGGIDIKEIKKLNAIGFNNVSLGNNILRAETAPLYILSSLIYLNK